MTTPLIELRRDIHAHPEPAHQEHRTRGDVLGPLHGAPITIKVNVDVAGRPTTGGIVASADNVADQDAPLVHNLRRAGAVIV